MWPFDVNTTFLTYASFSYVLIDKNRCMEENGIVKRETDETASRLPDDATAKKNVAAIKLPSGLTATTGVMSGVN